MGNRWSYGEHTDVWGHTDVRRHTNVQGEDVWMPQSDRHNKMPNNPLYACQLNEQKYIPS